MKALTGGRLYYGWYVVGITMAGGFLAAGTSQLFMGVMLKPITEDLGVSRTAAAGAMTLATLAAGFLSPLTGWLTDRYGPRLLAPSAALVIVGAYLMLASVSELWHFYLAYLLGRGIAATSIGGVMSLTVATNWFRRRRGRALGLVSMAVPLGGSALALVGQLIIEVQGWRTVFVTFACLLLVLYVVPAALIIRRRPEDLGLLPDGDPADDERQPDGKARAQEVSWTFGEAIRTRALWFLVAGLSIGTLANAAVGFHQVAYFTDRGISPALAASVLSIYGFSGAFSNAMWGWLVEHMSERLLAVAAMLLSAAAVAFLLSVSTPLQAVIFAIIFGLTARGEGSLVMMIIAQYYGRDSYGRISGIMTPFSMAGLGFGPLLASISYDATGSYDGAFVLFACSYFIAAALLWLARRPARQEAAPELMPA